MPVMEMAEKIINAASRGDLFNTFEIVYNNGHEQFSRWKEYADCLDIKPLHLAGSGPAVYYLSDDKDELMTWRIRKTPETMR